mgnify:CR=1 FL=1
MPEYHRKMEPVGGVLPDPDENAGKNWMFGGRERPILREDGNYTEDLPNDEFQATKKFDPFSCVSESAESDSSAILFEKMMKTDISIKPILESLGCLDDNGRVNFSGRFIAVGSGTIPGRGNSQYAVFEYIRKNGLVGEKMWPSNPEMSEKEYFATVPQSVKDLGKKFLQYFSFEYENVRSNNAEMKEALKRSPLCVVVGGAYLGGKAGAVLYRNNGTPLYNHQVVIYNQENNVNDFGQVIPVIHDIFDSYEPFRKRYVGTYPFKFVKAIFIQKKKIPMLYKKIGQPAICFKHWSEDSLIAFADGSIPGGDLFKSLFGVEKYSDLPRLDVGEWPFPIKYNLTTTGLISNLE